jgi:hypothetical protein
MIPIVNREDCGRKDFEYCPKISEEMQGEPDRRSTDRTSTVLVDY